MDNQKLLPPAPPEIERLMNIVEMMPQYERLRILEVMAPIAATLKLFFDTMEGVAQFLPIPDAALDDIEATIRALVESDSAYLN